MSNVYAGGVKATAIANIKAAALARWTTLADGSKDLNREDLAAWLRTEFNSMVPTEATDGSRVSLINVDALVRNLDLSIGRANMATLAGWPVASDAMDDSQRVSAVLELKGRLKNLSEQLTNHYTNFPAQVAAKIADYFVANVDGNYPATTARDIAAYTYIYTYVTDRGEESMPSIASGVVECDRNDTRELHLPPAPAGRSVTHVRVYRSQMGNSSINYLLVTNKNDVKGWPVSGLATDVNGFYILNDGVKDEDLSEVCPSFTWAEPPADFRGIQSMGNGIHVGYSGNTIMPCEPYRPFAYPLPYWKTTSHPIVGMCALDQLLVVGTTGPVKLLYGSSSDQLTEIRHNSGLSVAAARSMVAMSSGVVAFASPSGVCTVNDAGTFTVVTGPEGADLFSKEDWQALGPASIFACEWEGHYLFHVPAGFCYCLNLKTGKLTRLNVTGSAFYVDKANDQVYMAQGTTIKALGGGTGRRTGLWRSKVAVMAKPTGWRWLQVNAPFPATVTVRIYRDGVLWHTKAVTNNKPSNLPPSKGIEWEVEVESTSRVEQVTIASSTEELKDVGA